MDASSPPTKPPRGIKSPKETSGLLMLVIRALSKSESNEQRDREKDKLEREYKKSDQQLNVLVSRHKQDLTNVMQLFGKVSCVIVNARDKLHSIKETLQACKMLLSCRRDELKKLWIEGIEHKHILQLLGDIDKLKGVPAKLAEHLENKEYLLATKLLVSAQDVGHGSLEGVEALRELRNELQSSKEKLYKQLLGDLLNNIYVQPTKELRRFGGNDDVLLGKSKWSRRNIDGSCDANDSLEAAEVKNEKEIANLVECLALLNKLGDAVESIKMRMQTEVLGVINSVSKTVASNPSENVHPLLDLLDTLIFILRKVAHCHNILLSCLEEAAKTYKVNVTPFQPSDIWTTIQAVLQLLLTDYLDIQNASNDVQQESSFSDYISDISSYFSRRRIPRSQKLPLFKFEYSSHAVTTNSTKDPPLSNVVLSNISAGKQREKSLVVSPDPFNITVIFTTLQQFIQEIDEAIETNGRMPCTLHTFVNDYVRDVFIGRERSRISGRIETSTKTADAWRTPTPPSVMSDLSLQKPLLLSTVSVSKAIGELEALLDSLPHHNLEVLSIIVGFLKSYNEICHAAYRGIVQPEPEDKRLCSAAWLKDEDINRFLKSLPNWIDLQSQKSVHRSGRVLKREDTTEEESPEEVRQRNIKEAEILASNLGEGGIGPHEIISDPIQLKCLALLQESMEWFAWRILQISNKVKKSQLKEPAGEGSGSVPSYLSALQSFSLEFEELANTCLLVLHLEVRVQCFHYLLPRGNVSGHLGGNAQDPDPKVLELSRVLISIEESLSSSLLPRKTKYIFEGLGHLIAKILMSSVQYIDTIDEAAIQKMCRNIFTLQQTLSNITNSREVALDHARHYFQLFFLTHEEILSHVLETGPEFSELEYMNAFQLIHRSYSQHEDQSSLQKHLQRLSDILAEVGVAV